MLDLGLAVVHHLLIFALFGVLFGELLLVRAGMDQSAVSTTVAIDLWYGIIAAIIIVAGFSRAIFAAKGWSYYAHNMFFWCKISVFVIIGLLSVPPTLSYIRWRRRATAPTAAEIMVVRRFLYGELALFAALPAFAAAMARGYGEW